MNFRTCDYSGEAQMNLLNIAIDGSVRLGAQIGDDVLDVSAALPQPEFRNLRSLLHAGDESWRRVEALVAQPPAQATRHRLADARHAPLVAREARIFAVGLNYADHAAENKLPPPASPIFFSKLAATVMPHRGAVPLPAGSEQVDYEAELAFVLRRRLERASEAEAARAIAGYTIVNDVTARDFQARDGQWFRGKNCNGFTPMGPWLTTADTLPSPPELAITLRLNGITRQSSNTRNLFFKPAALASFLSHSLTLEPGDAITTGTPAGIGFFQKPPLFLRTGDAVEVEIEGIGVLRHTVTA